MCSGGPPRQRNRTPLRRGGVRDRPSRQRQQKQNRRHRQQDRRQQQRQIRPRQQQKQQHQRPRQQASVHAEVLATLVAMSTGKKIMENAKPEAQDSRWLAAELLRRTDLSTGDICMFHYPMDFFPKMDADEMAKALQMIVEGEVAEDEDVELAELSNALPDARSQITRIQFSWYQFKEVPRDVLGRAYRNLQHLDIRQNASLTCIDSIISQLPGLTSLNLSDCPNIRTLAPLATAITSRCQGGIGEYLDDDPSQRALNLRHLWIRGCNLSSMSEHEWSNVFDALAASTGPLERLTLSRNNMSYLHSGVGRLKSLTYLFVEDNSNTDGGAAKAAEPGPGFGLPDELGDLPGLRFVSLCGNGLRSLPRTMGRLHDECDLYLHRNPALSYPPAGHRSVPELRRFFHRERMALLRGAVLLLPHLDRARWRANERLYAPGGGGYLACKERFEGEARRFGGGIGSSRSVDELPGEGPGPVPQLEPPDVRDEASLEAVAEPVMVPVLPVQQHPRAMEDKLLVHALDGEDALVPSRVCPVPLDEGADPAGDHCMVDNPLDTAGDGGNVGAVRMLVEELGVEVVA